jgi:hypothetical protein
LLLILAGVGLAFRSLRAGRLDPAGKELDVQLLNEWAVFGGGRMVNTSQDFLGGEVLVMFGGYDLDLTRAQIKSGQVEIQANAIWGGIELRVPRDWQVISKGTPIFGGYADKRTPALDIAGQPGKRLMVRGFAIFGGVEINSKGA